MEAVVTNICNLSTTSAQRFLGRKWRDKWTRDDVFSFFGDGGIKIPVFAKCVSGTREVIARRMRERCKHVRIEMDIQTYIVTQNAAVCRRTTGRTKTMVSEEVRERERREGR